MLDRAFERMQEASCAILPVVRGGGLVGVVTLESFGERVMIQTSLRSSRPRSKLDVVKKVGKPFAEQTSTAESHEST